MDFEILKDYLRPYYLKWLYFRVFPERRANYLIDCWSKPHLPVSEKIQEIVPRRPDGRDVLFLPMTDWHARLQRSQHLAMNFGSLGARCFYLNPHLGREFPHPYRRRHAIRAGLVAPRVLELHIHLPREPIYHRRMLTSSETDRLFSGVERLLKPAGVGKLVQIVSFPLWRHVAVRLKREFGFPIIYDCHDLLSGFRDIDSDIVAAEAAMLESADLVSFSSQWLFNETARERSSIRTKSIVVRNGVNPADYSCLARRDRAGQPVIGYAGSLNYWFDVEAIRQAAVRRPEWRFILIGRVEFDPIHQLASLPNVSLIGEVAYSELPGRLFDFDVAVIPFLRTPLTLATNPLKLYEYFCLGIPVVSTRLPEIELFHDLVNLYDGAADFVRQLELAVAENDEGLQARRKAAAESNSWRARCEQLNQQFESL